jgi:SAM-dependent methyltransferase
MSEIRIHFGCGDKVGASWLNFDTSPMLKVERIPIIGGVLRLLAGGGAPFPRQVLFGNIVNGPLVDEGSAVAVYASHVLEHLSLQDARSALKNTFRMLAPGGVFRLIVPDLRSRAELYLRQVQAGDPDAASNFMRFSLLGQEERPRGLVKPIRRAFSGSSHLWMWDSVSMRRELEDCGFERIRVCQFGDSKDPAFAELEDQSRFIDSTLQTPECALEAYKPANA